MQKIKIITDSASDIPLELAKEYDIEVIGFELNIDGKIYQEGKDLTTDQFYDLLESSSSLPKTVAITPMQFENYYKQYYDEGYTDILYVSIASRASGTFNNSLIAKANFFDNNPELKLNIVNIDGKNYSGSYGYPIIQAAKKLANGESLEDVAEYIEDWTKCVEIYFTPYSLRFVRKSGRLNAAAAFAGEVLGLKPVISLIEAVSGVCAKIRGEKNIFPGLLKFTERMVPQSPYTMLIGRKNNHTVEWEKELTKHLGYPPEMVFQVGVTIASHAGTDLVGIIFRGEKRD